MTLAGILKSLAGTIFVLFFGIVLVLALSPLPGAFATGAIAIALFTFATRHGREFDRVLRLLFLPLLGPARGARPIDPGPVLNFLGIELDRRERTAAAQACIAAVCVHGARMGGGRFSERGQAALGAALKHHFNLAYDGEWITYIILRVDSLVASMDAASRGKSLDETIVFFLELLPYRQQPAQSRETRALLFALFYQSLLCDGQGIAAEQLFERVCRRHGLGPGELEANKAAGRYYFYAFRHRSNAESDHDQAGDSPRRKSRKKSTREGRAGSRAGKRGTSSNGSRTAKAAPGTNNATRDLLKTFELRPDYDSRDLERAWKRILHAYHPDRHHGDAAERDLAHERFLEMKRGYEILKNSLQPARPASQH